MDNHVPNHIPGLCEYFSTLGTCPIGNQSPLFASSTLNATCFCFRRRNRGWLDLQFESLWRRRHQCCSKSFRGICNFLFSVNGSASFQIRGRGVILLTHKTLVLSSRARARRLSSSRRHWRHLLICIRIRWADSTF